MSRLKRSRAIAFALMAAVGLLLGLKWVGSRRIARPPHTGPAAFVSAPEGFPRIISTTLPTAVQLDVSRPQTTPHVLGAGVIFRRDGVILTAAHVVRGVESPRVRLSDGREFEGQVIGRDENTNLAVVKIQAEGLPEAQRRVEPPRLGESVWTVGHPQGLPYSLEAGMVSGLDRHLPILVLPLIQTNMDLPAGYGGAPVFDREGRWVGASIHAVAPSSPAEKAGLKAGDVLQEIAGRKVASAAEAASAVRAHRVGEEVHLTLWRNGKRVDLKVTLSKRPPLTDTSLPPSTTRSDL